MNRGVSAGGGQSSLGYLFGGGGDSAKPVTSNERKPASSTAEIEAAGRPSSNRVVTPSAAPPPAAASSQPAIIDASKQIPAGIHSSTTNNYTRADGQNTGNFLTDRPSTKVHAAPGGGSSLDYLFGGGK